MVSAKVLCQWCHCNYTITPRANSFGQLTDDLNEPEDMSGQLSDSPGNVGYSLKYSYHNDKGALHGAFVK